MSPLREVQTMSRSRAKYAKAALALALLLAVGPACEQWQAPLTGVRTALELIGKEPGRAIKYASFH